MPAVRRHKAGARSQAPGAGYHLVLMFAIVVTYVTAVVLISAVVGVSENSPLADSLSVVPAHQNYQPSFLNGRLVLPEQAKLRPVAVMIDNHPEAHPLAGLTQASVVYEAPAEGGLSRFMVLLTPDAAGDAWLGPVRSARPYFIDWAGEWQAVYAHSGGSPAALQQLKTNEAVIDVNEFSRGQYFWRDRQRAAPHNLYTSLASLEQYRAAAAVSPAVDITSRPWIDSHPTPVPNPIAIQFMYTAAAESDVVEWRYQADDNVYLRFQDGMPLRDTSGQQVSASNIIVQYVRMRIIDDIGRKDITTTGSGRMALFQNGTVIEGQWQKSSRSDHTVFADASGKEVPLVRGQIWIEIIPLGTNVSWR